jgi:DNA polymerase/3'-5' exonuclease PolX
MDKFKTISNLIANIKENNKCLNDIYVMDKNKKLRKINKTCIENIQRFLK